MATVRRFLSDQLIAARNHARHAELPAMRTVLARQIRGLREDIKRVDGAIDAAIKADKALAEQRARMCSMTGVGPVVSAGLLAWLPELGHVSASKLAALVGVARSTTTVAGGTATVTSAAAASRCVTCSIWRRW